MKSRIVGLTMLIVVGYVSNSYSFVQLNCTNHGCMTVNVMAHVYTRIPDWQNRLHGVFPSNWTKTPEPSRNTGW